MLSCLLAKRLGAKHTIARVRNPMYYRQIDMLKEDYKKRKTAHRGVFKGRPCGNTSLRSPRRRSLYFLHEIGCNLGKRTYNLYALPLSPKRSPV